MEVCLQSSCTNTKLRSTHFYGFLDSSEFKSESATKYQQRFQKNRDTLFTFLHYDGVPWNNNNAEHAIKAFARLRDVIGGSSTKRGINEYLTLLSVAETCEYQGLDFLDFLRSEEKDIETFSRNRCRYVKKNPENSRQLPDQKSPPTGSGQDESNLFDNLIGETQ
ncbi:MAG: transposase [Betaproteobacteria bacterium]|nr:transposase [Betaproteobacteria bacterium]